LPDFLLANVLLGVAALGFGFWFFRLFKQESATPRYFASVGIVLGAIATVLSLPGLLIGWF
jgi:thiol:disulfide interchange protein